MKKTSKLLLSLGSIISAVTVTPMISAACGNGDEHPKAPTEKVADIKENKEFKTDKPASVPKVAVITDGGDINDKSFNQSAWEGVHALGKQLKMPVENYNPILVQNRNFEAAYNTALTQGYKYWVLPGFLHADQIKAFYAKHKDEIIKKGIRFIALDFVLDKSIQEGTGVSLNFKTKEGGFAAGYAAAKFLSTFKNKTDRTFSTFGGGAFPGVTDFNEGFYKGVYHWNKQQTNKDTKVTSVDGDKVELGSGFEPNDTMNSVVNSVLSKNPKLVLPVAGTATRVVTENDKFGDKYVIGVDADQALTATKKKNNYFTSILKRIGQAVYDVTGSLTTNTKIGEFIPGFEDGKKSASIAKGYNDGWVGLAKSYITGDKATTANEALEEGKKALLGLSETEKAWLHSNKVTPEGSEVEDIQSRINQLSKATTVEL
ncbi:BMP family ABC transporter substrate-binding protein [Metamycoplasma buccale]|uniref:BMP family ABC transporter substrate-binding protein n=1 Tax=Metamycoplasma buccale TaxID=55602 RepID=UPI00398EDAF3